MIDWLIEPLGYEFMRNALAVGILIGILCPVVGTYLIVQRMALLGDVIAHGVLPGLAIAFFIGVDILVGAFISGIFSTFLIAWIRAQSRVKVDAAMALTFSSSFALGVILITQLKSKLDLDSFLFGDILGVTITDVQRTAIITLTVLLMVKLFYKELLLYTFDKLGAQALGFPINALHYGLMAAITLTIVASMKTVGVVLISSLLVCPSISAYLLVKELHQVMVLGAILGVIGSISGMYISYYLNVPSGPAIVLVIFGLFLLALLFSPSQGILTRPEMTNRSRWIFRQLKDMRRGD
ncbi:MAG TPA: metal ABC transporter permease [Coleofasciculaceae cyanobacterium]|jgi:manganese/iron transport system permease protein